MSATARKPRATVRMSADVQGLAVCIKPRRETDREFLDRLAPRFDMHGEGRLRSQLETELYWRLRYATT